MSFYEREIHLREPPNKNIELYFGGSPGERLRGKVVGCDECVLILEYKGRKDYVNADRIQFGDESPAPQRMQLRGDVGC